MMSGRHLDLAILLNHVEDGVPHLYPFPGDPPVRLRIEGSVPRLSLEVTVDSKHDLPPSTLVNVRSTIVVIDGHRHLKVTVTGAALILDGHRMLCAIADRIQLDGLSPVVAYTETLEQWKEILVARSRMSREAEVGLFGELSLLEALKEEHDFGVPDLDLEVKTTTSEQRVHTIHGLGQLTPTPGRALLLMSIQVTSGGAAGRTLAELIVEIRTAVGTAIDLGLARAGWDNGAADLYCERWVVRTRPAVFTIDAEFPALTRERVDRIHPSFVALDRADYRLRLDGVPTADDVPNEAARLIEWMEKQRLWPTTK
jgi:hypothetical protein